MKRGKSIYTITTEDVINVSKEMGISVSAEDLHFIEDKVGDFFGSQWHDALEYALTELEQNRKNKQ